MDPFYFFVSIIVLYIGLRFILAPTIAPSKAHELINEGATIFDVRTEGEYADGHITDSINIPHFRITEEIERHVAQKEKPILLYCLSGTRSATAARMLKRAGYTNVFNLGTQFRAQKILNQYHAQNQ